MTITITRRALWVVCAVVIAAACSDTGADSADTTVPAADSTVATMPERPCAPTPEAPWRGMAAITEEYRVRVWNKGTDEFTEFEQIGDDPRRDEAMGDFNVVETVTVDPRTCEVFVGTCCEPVTGVTYYNVDESPEKWLYFMGHYPSISPDATRLAYSGYEDLYVTPLDDPQQTLATIKQPPVEEATVYDVMWLDNDNLVLLGFAADGGYLWRATVGTETLSTPVRITTDATSTTGNIWGTALVGVDGGQLIVRTSTGGKPVLQRRSLDTLELIDDEPFESKERTYRISSGRAISVSEKGRLMAFPVGADDAMFMGGPEDLYLWAG